MCSAEALAIIGVPNSPTKLSGTVASHNSESFWLKRGKSLHCVDFCLKVEVQWGPVIMSSFLARSVVQPTWTVLLVQLEPWSQQKVDLESKKSLKESNSVPPGIFLLLCCSAKIIRRKSHWPEREEGAKGGGPDLILSRSLGAIFGTVVLTMCYFVREVGEPSSSYLILLNLQAWFCFSHLLWVE